MSKAVWKGVFATCLISGGLYFALAGSSSDCQQACHDQFLQDTAACNDAYQQKLEELSNQQKECKNLLPDQEKFQECMRQVVAARQQAALDHQRCLNTATDNSVACLKACNQSPSAP